MPKTRSQTKSDNDFDDLSNGSFSLALRETMANQPSKRTYPPITNYPNFRCK